MFLYNFRNKKNYYKEYIDKVEQFNKLTKYQKQLLCDAIIEESYVKDTTIIREDDIGDKFFIIDEGELYSTQKNKKFADLKQSQYFGETALANNNEKNSYTVITNTNCKLLVIDKVDFKRILNLHVNSKIK